MDNINQIDARGRNPVPNTEQLTKMNNDIREYEAWKASRNQIKSIELKSEPMPIPVPKEKKPRTQKQLDATQRMRDALMNNRSATNTKKTEHTEQYQKNIEETKTKASELQKVFPDAKITVKSNVGRPKGSKNPPLDPTPYQSDVDDDAPRPTPKKKIPPRQQPQQQPLERINESLMNSYLSKLNGNW